MAIPLHRRKRLGVIVGGLLALAGIVAFSVYRYTPRRTPPGQPPLAHVTPESFEDLRAAFNLSRDEVRVFALLSPT